MGGAEWLSREGHGMLQLGFLLFLFGLLAGFAVPSFAVPRLGLTTHVLGVTQGVFLIVVGLLWPKLKLTRTTSGIGFWLAGYSCFVSWAVTLLAGVWGAGSSMMPIAAGQARGSRVQEGIIATGLMTAAATLIALTILILWGLRAVTPEEQTSGEGHTKSAA